MQIAQAAAEEMIPYEYDGGLLCYDVKYWRGGRSAKTTHVEEGGGCSMSERALRLDDFPVLCRMLNIPTVTGKGKIAA